MNRPNIVFLFTDDQRFDTIKALGNEQIITPNMDKLVACGTTFTHAHIPGGTAQAVCMPSRAMVNTGRSLYHLEGAGAEIPMDHELLGETLQRCGYSTYGIGKWHNGKRAFTRSFSGGSRIFFGGMGDHWNVPSHEYDSSGKYDHKLPRCKDCFSSNELEYSNCENIFSGHHSTDLFQEAASKFIENYQQESPFYLYLSFMAPHDPRTMPQEFLDMYKDIDIQLPKNFMEQHPFDNGELGVRAEFLAALPREPEEIKQHIKEYYAMITHLDSAIGKVMESLEKSGKLDNTIIIFAGDNGLALGQHGLMGKQSMYDHSVRVPLIFAGKGIPKNVQTDNLAYLFDIYPTICDILEVEIPASVDGISLYPTILDSSQNSREALYLSYIDVQRGVTDGRYKLIEYAVNGRGDNSQFFDLIADPCEANNLYNNVEYKDLIAEFKRKMSKFRASWHDDKHSLGEKFWQTRTDLL